MNGRHQLNARVLAPLTAEPSDGSAVSEQRVRSELSKRDDDFGLNRLQLSDEERFTRGDLIWLGISVVGRPAFDDVADVDVVSRETHGLNHLGQQLAGLADKG